MQARELKPILQDSQKSVLLLGPRQTGKSTLLKSLAPELAINLSDEAEYFRHQANPALLRQMIAAQKPDNVFIDEIQRLPGLLNTVQAIIDDAENPPRFYLSGSSARKLRRGHANLLPGRLFVFYLGGLSPSELGYRLDEDRALSYGLLPEPYLNRDAAFSAKLLTDYAATYLAEEIQAEALTRNIGGFARFLTELAHRAGKIIDLTKLAQAAKLRRSSVIGFLEILEDTLIAERVGCFTETAADTVKHPRIYFFDNGVLAGLTGQFNPAGEQRGVMAEHLVYTCLRNAAKCRDTKLAIWYFRTRGGLEVDFVVRLAGKTYAIEVKAGEVTESDLSSLRQFSRYYPSVERSFAVAPNETLREISGITICGINDLVRLMGL